MRTLFKILVITLFSALFLNKAQTHAFAVVDENLPDDAEVVITSTPEEETKVFTIFTHEDCGHCAAVKAFVENYGIEENVEYFELKNNDANMKKLESTWKEYNIPGTLAWPLLVANDEAKTYHLGSTPIMTYLSDELSLGYVADEPNTDNSTTDSDDSGDKIFFALGGIFVVGVLGYAVYSVLRSE